MHAGDVMLYRRYDDDPEGVPDVCVSRPTSLEAGFAEALARHLSGDRPPLWFLTRKDGPDAYLDVLLRFHDDGPGDTPPPPRVG
jgi:hypothetical protein